MLLPPPPSATASTTATAGAPRSASASPLPSLGGADRLLATLYVNAVAESGAEALRVAVVGPLLYGIALITGVNRTAVWLVFIEVCVFVCGVGVAVSLSRPSPLAATSCRTSRPAREPTTRGRRRLRRCTLAACKTPRPRLLRASTDMPSASASTRPRGAQRPLRLSSSMHSRPGGTRRLHSQTPLQRRGGRLTPLSQATVRSRSCALMPQPWLAAIRLSHRAAPLTLAAARGRLLSLERQSPPLSRSSSALLPPCCLLAGRSEKLRFPSKALGRLAITLWLSLGIAAYRGRDLLRPMK